MDASGVKMLGKVPGAENLLVTADNRWLVSGSKGFFQIAPDGATSPQQIPIAFDTHSVPSLSNQAFFLGIAQYQDYVYATCTRDSKSSSSPRYIMFMDMKQFPLSMAAIHQISNPRFFNGLATDADGNLYLTDAGDFFPPHAGCIVKLNMAAPTAVADQLEWLKTDGHPNGLKIDGNTLYYSEEALYLFGNSCVRKAKIKPDGTADVPQTVYSVGILRLLDDIDLVDDGLLITQAGLFDSMMPELLHNSRFNKIIHISENGQELHHSHMQLSPPSAVKLVPAPVLPSLDFIVTERTGEVIRLSPGWDLQQRH